MKTRIADFLDVDADPPKPHYSFQYAQGKRPIADDWKYVNNGHGEAATWPTKVQRDRARLTFTGRRSVAAAMADLKSQGLLSTN